MPLEWSATAYRPPNPSATVAAMKAVFDSGTNYPGFGHAMAEELAQSAYKLLLCYDLHGAC